MQSEMLRLIMKRVAMLTIDGIVIRERSVGEQDKFIDVLTAKDGVIEISVKGAKKINSKSGSSTQLFAYSRFCVQLRKQRYYLNSAEPVCIFYNLRTDIKKLSLAAFFADIVNYTIDRQNEYGEVLRLMLNTLHYLENDKRPLEFLKSLFELRLCAELGMMPAIVGCSECGEFEPEKVVFRISDGDFCCKECCEASAEESFSNILSDKAMLHAIRHIVLTDFSKLYNFRVSERIMKNLSEYTERYLINHLGCNFRTLDFYRSL